MRAPRGGAPVHRGARRLPGGLAPRPKTGRRRAPRRWPPLAGSPPRRACRCSSTESWPRIRRVASAPSFAPGGWSSCAGGVDSGELRPDFGPAELHPSAGATLVTARPPLAAFNVELEGAEIEATREIADRLRESGGGLPGVRALGIDLGGGRTQVSTNVHDPIAVPLAQVIERVRELAAAHGARPVVAEIVGLVPEASLDGLPDDVPLAGFDPAPARDRAAACGVLSRRLSRRPRSPGAPGPSARAAP